ncbi:NfeD family protein [Paenibacillus shirakamiensis]
MMLFCIMTLLPLGSVSALANSSTTAGALKSGSVYVISVTQKIESGLFSFMERGFQEAKKQEAALVVLEVNTPGGRIDSAEKIASLITDSGIPTVAFIMGDAASAGSYISLHADKIAMKPDSMIGAAALVDGSGRTVSNPKEISYWKSRMRAAAELHGRDARIAEGMVDSAITVDMPNIGKTKVKDQIISLSSSEAIQVGYADKIATSTEDVIKWMGYNGENTIYVEQTWAEKLAAVLTHPVVSTVLLLLGIAGVVIELLIPGFGVPGILGVASFGLYFFGNYIAGFAGWETGLLFVIGLILLALELFVPSFGILGLLGSASLIAGVVRAAYDTQDAFRSLAIAFGAALVVIIIVVWMFKEKGIWNRFMLKDELTKEKGYSASDERLELLGQVGSSLTILRPSGMAQFGDERIDVVTEGVFIQANTPVKVIKVEGSRVVVVAGF